MTKKVKIYVEFNGVYKSVLGRRWILEYIDYNYQRLKRKKIVRIKFKNKKDAKFWEQKMLSGPLYISKNNPIYKELKEMEKRESDKTIRYYN
jgi:hypothetical protein